jgi:MFS family permease
MAIALVLLLSGVTFVSLKGGRVLLALYSVELGAGPLETGLLFALYGLIPFLLVVYAGRLADRIGNRALMYVGLAGFAGALTLPALVASLPMLFFAAPLIGLTSMLFIVAMQALMGELSRPETRTRNFSYYGLTDAAGNVTGPVLVGFTIDGLGHAAAYWTLAAIAGACLVVFHCGRGQIPGRPAGGNASPPGASLDLLRLPALRNVLITNGIVMTGMDLYNVFLPVYASGIGLSASTIGVIVGAFGAAGFLVRVLIPPVTARWGEHAMIAATLALACVSFVAIPLTANPWLLGTVSFLIGLGLGCGQPLAMVLAYNAAPPGRSSEAIAMRMAVSYGAHVVVPPLFGVIGAVTGLAPLFWACAGVMACGSMLMRRGPR